MFNRVRTVRKRWYVVSATVALLVVGLTAGSIFAAAPSRGHFDGDAIPAAKIYPAAGGHHAIQGRITERVAEILGIEQEELTDAFAIAYHELADEQFAERMDALVESEEITADQRDIAVDWFADRPADAGFFAYIAVGTADADRLTEMLDRAVEKEMLTQDQADAISAWHGERPDFLPEHGMGHDRDGGRRHGGRGHDRDGDNDSDGDGSPAVLIPATINEPS